MVLKKLLTTSFVMLITLLQMQAQDFVHPGAMHTKKDLDFVKSKIQSNQEPWKSAYTNFLTQQAHQYAKPYSSLDYSYNAFETVECGFFNDPSIGCYNMVRDGIAAYSLALQFYFTDDVQYAAKSIEIINAWSLEYRSNEDQNSRLVVSWSTPWYVNAAEILRYTNNSGWTTTNTNRLNTMLNRFKEYIYWDGRPFNNWIMSAIEARLAIPVFQDDRTMFNGAISAWKQRIKTYIYQTSDGATPINPNGETTSYTESVWREDRSGTVYINGLCMETCRDIPHTKLGFNSLMYGAETAWNQGIDLFNQEQKRIADFLELHANWMMGGTVPNNICDGYLDGANEDGFEVAYNHINNRLGRNLPNTQQMNTRNRPTGPTSGLVTKWETLMFAERTFDSGNTANDDIVSVSAPTSVQRGNTVSVSVNYSASTDRDISVIFQQDQSPWTTYVSQKKDVSAG